MDVINLEFEDLNINSCPICFYSNEDNNIITLECNHQICEKCFIEWHIKKYNLQCVLCRQSITDNFYIRPNIQIQNSENLRNILSSSQYNDDILSFSATGAPKSPLELPQTFPETSPN